MIVKVSCSCGRITKLDAASAGRRFRCPICDKLLTVPVASTAEEEANPYVVEGLSEQGKEVEPRPRAKKPPCFFCGTRKKVTLFQVWTGTRGEKVEVRAANDEIILGPSYRDLIGYDVPACKPCAGKICRRYRKWLLWTALGQLVLWVVLTIALVWIYLHLGNTIVSEERLILAVATDLVLLGGFLGALGSYLFGGTTFEAAEKAIAHMSHKEIDPDGEVGLSSDQLKELQPRQVHGTPRRANDRE